MLDDDQVLALKQMLVRYKKSHGEVSQSLPYMFFDSQGYHQSCETLSRLEGQMHTIRLVANILSVDIEGGDLGG